MNLEKLKELAVPVSERLPNNDKSTDVILLYKGKEEQGRAFYQNDHWYLIGVSYIGEQPVVTHWIDFDLLTSKKKAVELAELAYIKGYDHCNKYHMAMSEETDFFCDFLTENQSKL